MTEQILALAITAMNVLAFSLMGEDKRRAKRRQWRIPERTLLLVSVCFGALGGWLGMRTFRHKTRHRAFRWGLPAMLAVQIGLLLWLGLM